MGGIELIFGIILSLILVAIIAVLPTIFLCRSHLGRIISIIVALIFFKCKAPIEELLRAMREAGFNNGFLYSVIEFAIEILLFLIPLIGVILFVVELISIINLAMPYLPKPVRLTVTIIGILLVALISFATVQLVGIVPVGYAIASALKSWNNDKNK